MVIICLSFPISSDFCYLYSFECIVTSCSPLFNLSELVLYLCNYMFDKPMICLQSSTSVSWIITRWKQGSEGSQEGVKRRSLLELYCGTCGTSTLKEGDDNRHGRGRSQVWGQFLQSPSGSVGNLGSGVNDSIPHFTQTATFLYCSPDL